MKVLVAEDDANTRRGLVELLEAEGYQVVAAQDGQEALSLYAATQPDLLLLDVMMPKVDGFEVCRQVRRRDPAVPILFLSAKSEEIDRVVGLELGGDDFVVKPFGVREVVARIRALTRRAFASRDPPRDGDAEVCTLGDLRVYPAELRARRGEEVIELSLREVKLLLLFAANRGRVLDRNTILDQAWGVHYLPSSRTLDQQISQLRKKIERDPRLPTILLTVHGVGYRYDG
ncbi:MAG: response regulator transcription factor [Myxococcota bacterium]|jgi:DNA-binding response OmpR family regulator|nr:response regulator transcription factor [Myxococcota bacterium]